MAIKYKDFEKREQLRKDYMDKAAEAAKTQANAYTDEQIRNIPAPPAPDIPTALPQKYEAFKIQLVQGNISEGEDPMWSEYHETLWSGSEVLTNSSATTKAHFVTDTVLYWRSPRKYNLLITINGTEKEFVFEGEHSQYGTNWVIWQLKENDVVVAEAECIGSGNGQYYNNTSTVFVYCPDGSSYIGQTMTAARYGKKQYLYSLTNPAAILQQPSETENTRFLTMCQSIATKNAKLKLTLTDNVIEANYANISNELVTTDYVNGDVRARWIGIVADRVPNKANGTYIYEDMPTCIKGVLEVEYTDEEATKECVYDKIQGESYTFKIGDFNHDESSAFDYYFNGAALIPFDNAQIQASFTYRPVSGEEKTIQVKSMVNNGQMLPYFDISELFGQAANTVMAIITSNTAVENVAMGGRPVTTIALTSNVQNFTDANDEIMVGQILTLTPTSLPQTYKKKAVTLATSGWANNQTIITATNASGDDVYTKYKDPVNYPSADLRSSLSAANSLQINMATQSFVGEQLVNSSGKNPLTGNTEAYKRVIFNKGSLSSINADFFSNCIRIGSSDSSFQWFLSLQWKSNEAIKYLNTYTDADVKVNSEVRFTLDEANGKLAGQFGLKKTIDKEAGKLTFTADTLPTSAITGTLEIGETSTEGAAFVDGISEDSTGFVKATEENTFTKTQTFNGTESQAGIKTNSIDNESGNRVVYFNGTKQMFGSDAIPTQVRSSEQRLKLERPVSGGTGTEIVEIANLADLGTGGVIRKEVSLNWEAYDGEIDFSFTDLTKNYVTNSRFIEFWLDDNFTRLRLDIGKTYSISYNGTKYSAVATAATVGSYSTTKLEFTIGDKTLVILDQASASANISDENKPTHYNRSAIAYFSDYSTPSAATTITLATCPAAYKAVIPYDDSFTNSADVTIQSPYPSASNLYTPLFLAPSVNRGTDGYILYVPVVNTVTYSTDFVITPHSDWICPSKVLLTLNRNSGSVVRLSGFSNTYRRRLTLGYIINNTYWQQSGNKYIYTDTPSFTVNRFVNIELNFDNSTSLDEFTDAEVTIKKSCAWLPEKPTIMANSTPASNIKVEVYGRVSY